MGTLMAGPVKSVCLSAGEADLAREAGAALAEFVKGAEGAEGASEPLTLQLRGERTARQMQATMPAGAVRALAEVLEQMAKGGPVTLVPMEAELSTQQAADLMGVSRPYFVKLLEDGKIPFRKVGDQRRIPYGALLRYVHEYQTNAMEALEEMTAEAQRLGLYDDPLPPCQ